LKASDVSVPALKIDKENRVDIATFSGGGLLLQELVQLNLLRLSQRMPALDVGTVHHKFQISCNAIPIPVPPRMPDRGFVVT
jgi:hypothetical protein